MATRTVIELTDDTDGQPADESLTFGVDGELYEIDLTHENADRLREAFARWVDHARRVGRQAAKPTGATSQPRPKPATTNRLTTAQRHSIQRFAASCGMRPPAARGRIGEEVREAWEAAGQPA